MTLAFQENGCLYLVTKRTHTEILPNGSSSRYTFWSADGGVSDRKEALFLLRKAIQVTPAHVKAVWKTRKQRSK
jgi:hypothetical protein